MKFSLCLTYITARKEPHLEDWFMPSLMNQVLPGEYGTSGIHVIAVNFYKEGHVDPLKDTRWFKKGIRGRTVRAGEPA